MWWREKSRFNITWNVCSKYVGGAERAGWESDLEGGQQSKEAVTLVVVLASAFDNFVLSGLGDVLWHCTKNIKGLG